MLVDFVVLAFSVSYWVFVIQKKNGPGDLFAKLRNLANRISPTLGRHVSCNVCFALSIAALHLAVYFTPAWDILSYAVVASAAAGASLLFMSFWGHPPSMD